MEKAFPNLKSLFWAAGCALFVFVMLGTVINLTECGETSGVERSTIEVLDSSALEERNRLDGERIFVEGYWCNSTDGLSLQGHLGSDSPVLLTRGAASMFAPKRRSLVSRIPFLPRRPPVLIGGGEYVRVFGIYHRKGPMFRGLDLDCGWLEFDRVEVWNAGRDRWDVVDFS